jgi:hypothetical protein
MPQIGHPLHLRSSQQTARVSGEELLHGLDGCAMLTVNDYEYNLIKEKTGLTDSKRCATTSAAAGDNGGAKRAPALGRWRGIPYSGRGPPPTVSKSQPA